MSKYWTVVCGYIVALLFTSQPLMAQSVESPSVLKRVQEMGDLRCAVFPDDPGRSAIMPNGKWAGFYVDFCRAVAAAVLKNPDFVAYVEVGSKARFSVLQESKADVVMYSSTWTLGRESDYQITFPAIYLFDGQGFMVRKASGIKSINDLDGKSVCVTENTTTEQMLKAVIHNRQLNVKIIYANGDSFFRGDCDAYTADRMNLATNRANRADNPSNYLILDETISREPIGPMVRNDDAQWAKIIRAVVNWMILAEEKGVSTKTLDEVMSNTQDPELKNVFGQTGNIAEQLGLPQEWASQVIRAVGNYGEVYDRHFGPNTAIGVERGLNRPWNEGGVLLSPLFK